MNYETTMKLVEKDFEDEVLPGLSEFIKIDNLSPQYDPDWEKNGKLQIAAKHCLDWANKQGIQGLSGEIIQEEHKCPVVFIQIEPQSSNNNILLYGHFDKQPHFTGWNEGFGPLLPIIKDGYIYGRGSSDDGYAVFALISAIKSIQVQGANHGKISIIIEGGEESGSQDLAFYLSLVKSRIGVPDLMICLDSWVKDYNTLWLTSSLRGIIIMDLTIEVLEEGVHSGAGSGIAPDSFTILRLLLDRLEDSKTGKVIDDFQVQITENSIEEAKKLVEYNQEKVIDHVRFLSGVSPLSEDPIELVLNNTWRATLCVIGVTGLPTFALAGNVIRPETGVRLSMRIPPTLCPSQAEEKLKEILCKDPPFNCKVTTTLGHTGSGWASQDYSEKLHNSLETSSNMCWGKSYYKMGMGGTISFLHTLADIFPQCEILVMGVLGPDSNAHCSNECLNIKYCQAITITIAHTIVDMSS